MLETPTKPLGTIPELVPASWTVGELPEMLSLITKVPVADPLAVGTKATEMEQVPPAATWVLAQLSVSVNGPDIEIPPTLTATVW
jgi:hypothetical protein